MAALFPEYDEPTAPAAPPSDAPLAARMRPRTLDEFIGQEALVGTGTPPRRATEDDRMTSAIFRGPRSAPLRNRSMVGCSYLVWFRAHHGTSGSATFGTKRTSTV